MRLLVVALLALILAPATLADHAAAPTLKSGSSSFGKVVFDGRGFVLYGFTRDHGRSACYGACAKAWPPLLARGKPSVGVGLKRGLIGTVRRKDGRRQVTYAGKPLYYYVGDSRPGQILCQDVFEFGGRWLIVRPSGTLVR